MRYGRPLQHAVRMKIRGNAYRLSDMLWGGSLPSRNDNLPQRGGESLNHGDMESDGGMERLGDP
jgi:hypothetical protein